MSRLQYIYNTVMNNLNNIYKRENILLSDILLNGNVLIIMMYRMIIMEIEELSLWNLIQ